MESAIVLGQDSLSNAPYTEGGSSANAPYPEPAETTEVVALPITRLEFQLSLYVLAFGILVILLEIYLIRNKNISSEDTIKFVIITIIIVSTLFLITAGYSNDQIAPAVGLLGTIAGYLLGRINSPKKDEP
ncbi:MAG: hypothetical protein ACO1OF_04855 [Adhaeribacter sp.]